MLRAYAKQRHAFVDDAAKRLCVDGLSGAELRAAAEDAADRRLAELILQDVRSLSSEAPKRKYTRRRNINWYVITIAVRAAPFSVAYDAVQRMMQRAIWRDYTLAFRQASVGFCVRIVAHVIQPSAQTVRMDVYNSLRDVVDIDERIVITPSVDPALDVDVMIDSYTAGDAAWREALGLLRTYRGGKDVASDDPAFRPVPDRRL